MSSAQGGDAFAGGGKEGTVLVGGGEEVRSRKRWMRSGSTAKGRIVYGSKRNGYQHGR